MRISQPVALHQVIQGSIITCYCPFIYTNIVLVLVLLVPRNIKTFSDFDDEDYPDGMIKEGYNNILNVHVCTHMHFI